MRSHNSASALSSRSEKRERKCSRTTARWVPRATSRRSRPSVGEAGVGAASVVFAGAALQEPLLFEAVGESREPAARELGLLGEVAHAHLPAGGLDEVVEDLVGAERQPVRALELGVDALGERGVGAHQAAPRADLLLAECLLLRGDARHGGVGLDGCRCCHGVDAQHVAGSGRRLSLLLSRT